MVKLPPGAKIINAPQPTSSEFELKTVSGGGPTYGKKDPTLVEKVEEKVALGEAGAKISIKKEADAQEAKEAIKSSRSGRKLQSLLKQSLLVWAQAQNETTKITRGAVRPGQPSRLPGMLTQFLGAIGANQSAGPFEGDKVETATAIAKIAAPSAKVGPDLIKLFSKTLPELTSKPAEARKQIILSMANSLHDYAATHPKEFPNGAPFNSLLQVAEDEVDAFIKSRPKDFKSIYPDSFKGGKKKVQPGVQQTVTVDEVEVDF